MQVQPYLFFEGRAEEAFTFYRDALGAEVIALMRYKESPGACESGQIAPGSENKVMHAALRIGDSTIMASDGRCSGKMDFSGFSLSLSIPDAAKAERAFAALSQGGKIEMPMGETFFAHRFGMTSDRFGVNWMVICEKKH